MPEINDLLQWMDPTNWGFGALDARTVVVAIGAALIVWVMFGTAKGRFHAGYFLPVDLVGLYWHLVDLIWIFLFPLLYLVP